MPVKEGAHPEILVDLLITWIASAQLDVLHQWIVLGTPCQLKTSGMQIGVTLIHL